MSPYAACVRRGGIGSVLPDPGSKRLRACGAAHEPHNVVVIEVLGPDQFGGDRAFSGQYCFAAACRDGRCALFATHLGWLCKSMKSA